MYISMPEVTIDVSFMPLANNMSGIDVIGPVAIRSSASAVVSDENVVKPENCAYAINTIAIGSTAIVSMHIDVSLSAFMPFLSAPYSANDRPIIIARYGTSP